jgi:hypothetical protein
MKMWVKGAIIGLVFGLFADISYVVADTMDFSPTTILGKVISYMLGLVFGIPFMIAVYLGFGFYLAFIGPPVIDALVGALLGHSYELYRGRK